MNKTGVRFLLRYIRPQLWFFFFASVAVILSSISILGLGYGLQNLIDSGVNPSKINQALTLFLTLIFVMSLASFFRLCLVGYGGEKVIAHLRQDLYNHVLSLQPKFFEQHGVSEVTSSLITDTTVLHAVITGSMSVVFRNLTTFTGGLAMLCYTDARLTVYTAVVIPIILLIVALFGKKVRIGTRVVRDKMGDLAAHSEEVLRGINTVKAFCQENFERSKFAKLVQGVLESSIKSVMLRALLVTLIIASVTCSIGVVLWLGIKEVGQGNMTPGSLSAFIFYAAVVAGAINQIGDNINDIQRALGVADKISELMAETSDILEPDNPNTLRVLSNNISFNNVTFCYPANPDIPALSKLSFSIAVGETLALVGRSGGGKSTVLNLLLRFYDPQSGNITMDSIDIKSLLTSDLRRLFGVVSQVPVIFSGSVRDNIAYGTPDAQFPAIEDAARSARALDFIEALPDKFETLIGERGIKLSEGQKQRIVIARAILKNPQILLLDEATSALDSENESLIQSALEELMQNRTTLVIAHRLSTIMKADKIIVLDNGKIAEFGTHQSLLQKKGGIYAKLAKLQFLKGD